MDIHNIVQNGEVKLNNLFQKIQKKKKLKSCACICIHPLCYEAPK